MKMIKVESCLQADKKVFTNSKCYCYFYDDYTDEHMCFYDENHTLGVRKNTAEELFKSCPLEDMPSGAKLNKPKKAEFESLEDENGFMPEEKKENPLKILKGFEQLAKDRREQPISDGYWEEEAKLIKKLNEENERLDKAIRMSYETYHRPFDL